MNRGERAQKSAVDSRRRSRGQKSDRESHRAQASAWQPPKRRTGSPASVTDLSSLEEAALKQRAEGFQKNRDAATIDHPPIHSRRGEKQRGQINLRTLKDIRPQVGRKHNTSRGMKGPPKARAGTAAERPKEGREETAEARGSSTARAAERAEARTAAAEVESRSESESGPLPEAELTWCSTATDRDSRPQTESARSQNHPNQVEIRDRRSQRDRRRGARRAGLRRSRGAADPRRLSRRRRLRRTPPSSIRGVSRRRGDNGGDAITQKGRAAHSRCSQ
ncbi:hypothetical protein AOLI_G00215070 [Acnodon oligacanthus]